jgi:hypothetical protein
MKYIRPDRDFTVASSVYLLSVAAAFLVGLAFRDDHGVSFIPAMLLVFPWSFILPYVALPLGLFSTLTAFYDLPLFAISATINLGIAELVRLRQAQRQAKSTTITIVSGPRHW